MQDARFDKLASLLVDYSTALKRNEKVLIEAFDAPDEMAIAPHSRGPEGEGDPVCATAAGPRDARARARDRRGARLI